MHNFSASRHFLGHVLPLKLAKKFEDLGKNREKFDFLAIRIDLHSN